MLISAATEQGRPGAFSDPIRGTKMGLFNNLRFFQAQKPLSTLVAQARDDEERS